MEIILFILSLNSFKLVIGDQITVRYVVLPCVEIGLNVLENKTYFFKLVVDFMIYSTTWINNWTTGIIGRKTLVEKWFRFLSFNSPLEFLCEGESKCPKIGLILSCNETNQSCGYMFFVTVKILFGFIVFYLRIIIKSI